MARIRSSRGNFMTGLLSIEGQANTDSEAYNFALSTADNCVIKPLGGAYKRSGLVFFYSLPARYHKLIRFSFGFKSPSSTKLLDCVVLFKVSSSENDPYGGISVFFIDAGPLFSLEITSFRFIFTQESINFLNVFSFNQILYFFYKSQNLEGEAKSGFYSITVSWLSDSQLSASCSGPILFDSEPLCWNVPKNQNDKFYLVVDVNWGTNPDNPNDKHYGNYLRARRLSLDMQVISNWPFDDSWKGRNILLKFTKTQTYQLQDGSFIDLFPAGPYWIIARVPEDHTPSDELRLKLDIQDFYKIFPVNLDNNPGFVEGGTSNITEFEITAFDSVRSSGNIVLGSVANYPRVSVYYKGRLYFFIQNFIFASKLRGNIFDFSQQYDSYDSAYTISWGGEEGVICYWCVSSEKLIIGTNRGIYIGDEFVSVNNNSISYTTPSKLNSFGVSPDVSAIYTGNSIVFVSENGLDVYELSFSEGSYVANIINQGYQFTSKCLSMAYIDNFLYCVTEDGYVEVCCFANNGYLRRWSRFSFPGGAALSVVNCDSIEHGNRLFFVVSVSFQHDIRYFLCSLKEFYNPYLMREAEQCFSDYCVEQYKYQKLNYVEELYENQSLPSWNSFNGSFVQFAELFPPNIEKLRLRNVRFSIGQSIPLGGSTNLNPYKPFSFSLTRSSSSMPGAFKYWGDSEGNIYLWTNLPAVSSPGEITIQLAENFSFITNPQPTAHVFYDYYHEPTFTDSIVKNPDIDEFWTYGEYQTLMSQYVMNPILTVNQYSIRNDYAHANPPIAKSFFQAVNDMGKRDYSRPESWWINGLGTVLGAPASNPGGNFNFDDFPNFFPPNWTGFTLQFDVLLVGNNARVSKTFSVDKFASKFVFGQYKLFSWRKWAEGPFNNSEILDEEAFWYPTINSFSNAMKTQPKLFLSSINVTCDWSET